MRINSVYPGAIAYVEGGDKAPELKGKVDFYQKTNGVLIKASVTGLPASNASGFFGFHIHKGGGCHGEGFSETGSHFDKDDNPHPRHSGDLPPLLSGGGEAYLAVFTNRFSLEDIIGKTVVIHSMADDFTSQPAGNAGEKIACGVIKRI